MKIPLSLAEHYHVLDTEITFKVRLAPPQQKMSVDVKLINTISKEELFIDVYPCLICSEFGACQQLPLIPKHNSAYAKHRRVLRDLFLFKQLFKVGVRKREDKRPT